MVAPLNRNVPDVGWMRPEHDFRKHAFAAAGPADERDDFLVGDGKADVINRPDRLFPMPERAGHDVSR